MKTLATLSLSFSLCLGAVAQEGGDQAAALAEYMESIKPGPEHKELAEGVGTWNFKQTFFMPGAPEQAFDGVATNKLVLGGRYVVSEMKMNSFFGPYSGIGTGGYDKVNKRYTYTWIDTMGTGLMVSYGKKKEDGSIEYISEPQLDGMSGAKMIFRMVSKMDGDDKMTFDMFSKAADGGEETKMMNIVYTRKK